MAIAHVCHSCGLDLARIRARREPVYGLPLVTCTRCGCHAVRRRHPLAVMFRTGRRVDWALTVLLVQGVCAALSLLMLIGSGYAVPEIWDDLQSGRRRLAWQNEDLVLTGVLALTAAVFTGAWLRAGLSRTPYTQAMLGWLGVTLGVLLFGVASSAPEIRRDGAGGILVALVEPLFIPAVVITLLMLLTPIGIPIGRSFGWLAARYRQLLWRVRKRMRKATRSSQ